MMNSSLPMLSTNKPGDVSGVQLPQELLNTLEQESSAAYALDENLKILYCNPAWRRFAQANGGDGFPAPGPLGQSVLASFSEPLKTFYERMYRLALCTGDPWQQSYECSTPTLFRRFRMQVLKIEALEALVVTNFLEVECLHFSDRTPKAADSTLYLSEAGILAMCSNCRRVRQVKDQEIWDWVPEYLEGRRVNVSHGICPICIHQFLSLD